ncbi:hypothetical protein, partial [Paenibacillus tengchongensis]|uniref:hypothetical protein n=1 Tax=Paenibacillus tengchongensis TaxID=2608684 RepID=UPI001C9E39BB
FFVNNFLNSQPIELKLGMLLVVNSGKPTQPSRVGSDFGNGQDQARRKRLEPCTQHLGTGSSNRTKLHQFARYLKCGSNGTKNIGIGQGMVEI